MSDVRNMLEQGLVEKSRLWDLFQQIEAELIRYPAVEPAAFRARVRELTLKP